MTSIKVKDGKLTITDETIQIDLSPIKALKRIYEQSKLIVVFSTTSVLYIIIVFLIDLGPFYHTFIQVFFAFVIISILLKILSQELINSIKTASEIRRTAIDRVEYTTGSRVRLPKLRIIVDDGEKSGTRPVPLSHRRLGGDQQLEDAIHAFEDAGITIVPANEATDEDS